MNPIIINGKETAAIIRSEIADGVKGYLEKYHSVPGLAVIQVGNDPASSVYVRNKHKACEEIGIASFSIELPESTTEDELLSHIETLNKRGDVHGVLVQLPLPEHIDERKVIEAIVPEKDVDGFHPVNVGQMMLGRPTLLPCTPAGIIELLKRYNITMRGKHAVVIGRSNIVGKPISQLLLASNCTVTTCHSSTVDLAKHTKQADILVVAVGKRGFLSADMVKEGAIVIDVGIHRDENGKLCGDVDYASVAPLASAITPVPGGVGPMTIAMLMKNTLAAALASQHQ